MDSYLIKEKFRQDLTGFYFNISSFLKKLEIYNPLSAEKNQGNDKPILAFELQPC